MDQHKDIWCHFCTRMQINKYSVPLFRCSEDRIVQTKTIGVTSQRTILRRSDQMESMIRTETDTLVHDWTNERDEFDGLIYMMFLKESEEVVPLYIGKTETIGKGDRNLSVNIKNLHSDLSKFARWGDNYAYHIGDLSAVVLSDHNEKKIHKKYINWAHTLFVDFSISNQHSQPKLKQEIYFWTKAWKKTTVGIWEDFGATRLTFLEYLMIGVASSVFPDTLLNKEGQNRG
jgi:hypothetical protein